MDLIALKKEGAWKKFCSNISRLIRWRIPVNSLVIVGTFGMVVLALIHVCNAHGVTPAVETVTKYFDEIAMRSAEELLIAIFLAGVFKDTVEKAAHDRLSEQYNQQLEKLREDNKETIELLGFHFAGFGQNAEKSLVDEVRQRLKSLSFVRKDVELNVEIKPFGEKDDCLVRMAFTARYQIRNVLSEARRFKCTIQLEPSSTPSKYKDTYKIERVELTRGGLTTPLLPTHEIFKKSLDSTGKTLIIDDDLFLIQPNETITIHTSCWLTRRTSDTEEWITLHPATISTIRMKIDSELAKNMDFDAVTLHEEGLTASYDEKLYPQGQLVGDSVEKTWNFQHWLLTGHGILFRWRTISKLEHQNQIGETLALTEPRREMHIVPVVSSVEDEIDTLNSVSMPSIPHTETEEHA